VEAEAEAEAEVDRSLTGSEHENMKHRCQCRSQVPGHLEKVGEQEQAKGQQLVHVSVEGEPEAPTEQQQQQPVHADLQEGQVGVQRQGVPVVQPVANASLADGLEGPSEQQQQQPVHGDRLIAVLQLQERDPEEEKVVVVAEQMDLLP
jgi:hypothetical protein